MGVVSNMSPILSRFITNIFMHSPSTDRGANDYIMAALSFLPLGIHPKACLESK